MRKTKAEKKRGKKPGKVEYYLNHNDKKGSVLQEAPNLEEFVKRARENKWIVNDKMQQIIWLPHVSTVPIPPGMQNLRGSNWAMVRASTGEERYFGKLKAEEEARNKWYAEARASRSTAGWGADTPPDTTPAEVPSEAKLVTEHETAGKEHEQARADPQEDLQDASLHILTRQTEVRASEGDLPEALAMELDERELIESDLTNIVTSRRRDDIYDFMKRLQQDLKEMNTNLKDGLSELNTKMDEMNTKMDKGFDRLHVLCENVTRTFSKIG